MKNFWDPNFKFSEEDRETLWGIARKKFGPKKATVFVNWLLNDSQMLIPFKKPKGKRSHYEELQAMLINFRKTEKYLEIIRPFNGNWTAILPGTFKEMVENVAFKGISFSSGPEIAQLNFWSKKFAAETLPSLRNLIKTLEDVLKVQPLIGGRPKSHLPSFIRVVAQDYEEILGERPKNGGIFLKIIQELFSILELPSENPRRAIREALKIRN
jgi:hypothetical protein